jgi:hypothetical protein
MKRTGANKLNAIIVEDPFDTKHNLTRGIGPDQFEWCVMMLCASDVRLERRAPVTTLPTPAVN